MSTLRIPCPDLRDHPGPHYAGLYVLERRRLAEARCSATTSAAGARLAHYIARRSARAAGLIPGQIRDVRIGWPRGTPTDTLFVRVEIATATPTVDPLVQ